MALGPKNAAEAIVFAEEALRIGVQHRIFATMLKRNVTREMLAERLGITRTRVRQFFASHANLTTRTIARIFHALEEKPEFRSEALPQNSAVRLGANPAVQRGAKDPAERRGAERKRAS